MKAQTEQALGFFLDWIGYDVGYSEHHETALATERRERAETESRMSDEIQHLRAQVAALSEQLANFRMLARERTSVPSRMPPARDADQPGPQDDAVSTAPAVTNDSVASDSVLRFDLRTEPDALSESAAEQMDEDEPFAVPAESLDSPAGVKSDFIDVERISTENATPAVASLSVTDSPSDPTTGPEPDSVSPPNVASQSHSELSAFPPEAPAPGRRQTTSSVRQTLGLNTYDGNAEVDGAGSESSAANLYRSATSLVRWPSVQRPTMPSLTDLELPRMTSLVNRLVRRERSDDESQDEMAARAEPSVARERLEMFLRQEADDVEAVQDPPDRSGERPDTARDSE